MPDRAAWGEWLATHDDSDATSARIRTVQALEADGAEVMTVAADLADRAQMAAVVSGARARFGRIDGVVHAAGVAGAGTIQAKKRDAVDSVLAAVRDISQRGCENQFRPKMRGLFVLEDVLGELPLDFCLIVSSLSTVTGGPGYTAYAAANSFMDAFVHRHNVQSPVRWMTANWDAWSFQSGDAAASALARVTLTEEEGVEVFERLLSVAGLGHVIVSTINLYARLAPPPAAEAGPPAPEESSGGRTLYNRPASLESSYQEPQTPLERTVAGIWQEVLGMNRVGRSDSFFELGGHSLLAVQVAARLEDVLQMEVPMRNVFDAATLADLAARIEGALMAAQGEDEVLVGEDGGETEDVEI
jgi:acyl carrier protein